MNNRRNDPLTKFGEDHVHVITADITIDIGVVALTKRFAAEIVAERLVERQGEIRAALERIVNRSEP